MYQKPIDENLGKFQKNRVENCDKSVKEQGGFILDRQCVDYKLMLKRFFERYWKKGYRFGIIFKDIKDIGQ